MVQAAPPPGGIVLVVDDSSVARATVESRLVRRGLRVRTAGAVAEAAGVDLVGVGAALLDLELGDGSGVDVALRLRATSSSFPVAFLTSAPRCALADRARELGPIFEKGAGTDEAVAWVAGAIAPR
jgi:DNA-binding response OmpR family regulator